MADQADNMMTFSDLVSQTETLKPLMDLIEQIMALPDANLTGDNLEMISGMLTGGFTPAIKEKSITTLLQDFEEQGFTKNMVANTVTELKNGIDELIADLKPSAAKETLLRAVFGCFYEIFDGVLERFHTFSITLPFKLDEGAQVPTYAHESDACADVYASQDVLIKAHTISNMVHTGLHIALPEGWQARLAPRSSTGSKTPLRLSNSIGIIDSKQEATQWAA